MITADQLVLHAVGDYLLQSDWMAMQKSKSWMPAAAHAVTYALPFLFLTRAPTALLIIASTHYVIDRYRLARYVVWAKNFLAPKWQYEDDGLQHTRGGEGLRVRNLFWRNCEATGYPKDRPAYLAVWLLIVADNVLHVLLNGLALYFFGTPT